MVKTNRLANAIDALQYTPTARTDNGALTNASAGSALLDLFSHGAAMRDKSATQIIKLIDKAWKESAPLTAAALFYIRDVTQGQGERRFFRVFLTWLAKQEPEITKALLPLVPEYGRWDDIFALKGTELYQNALILIGLQLTADMDAVLNDSDASISLAAKWAPSEKAGKVSAQLAYDLRRVMSLSARVYRKGLSKLRAHLKIVESQMCAQNWNEIDYQHVPSRASMLYRKAFKKQDEQRYTSYLEAVQSGKATINSGTLYPYEIVEKVIDNMHNSTSHRDITLEEQWKALPNYVEERHGNSLVVVDTSGSMYGRPITVSVSLGLYIAERNTGVWKDKFITFDQKPQLIHIEGDNVTERIQNVYNAEWGGNTNLQKVFDLVLNAAKSYNLTQDEIPDTIYIVSDMQFDSAVRDNKKTNLQVITKKFEDAGYKRPNLVFWNVDAKNMESPARFNDDGVALFSGLSPTILKAVLTGEFNPMSAMLDILNSSRYTKVTEAVEAIS